MSKELWWQTNACRGQPKGGHWMEEEHTERYDPNRLGDTTVDEEERFIEGSS